MKMYEIDMSLTERDGEQVILVSQGDASDYGANVWVSPEQIPFVIEFLKNLQVQAAAKRQELASDF